MTDKITETLPRWPTLRWAAGEAKVYFWVALGCAGGFFALAGLVNSMEFLIGSMEFLIGMSAVGLVGLVFIYKFETLDTIRMKLIDELRIISLDRNRLREINSELGAENEQLKAKISALERSRAGNRV